MKKKFLLYFFLIVSLQASAEPGCDNVTRTEDHVTCTQSRFDTAERDLKAALKQVQAKIARSSSADGIDAKAVSAGLARSQAQWRRFVDSDCLAQRDFVGNGTARNAVELDCRVQHYEQRIQQLRKWGDG